MNAVDSGSTPKWVMWGFALLALALSAFGWGFFLLDSLAERDAFRVVEGDLVPGTVVEDDERLRFRIAGYERELFLDHPEELIPTIAPELVYPVRLRARIDPWANNAERASLITLEAIRAGVEPETLLTYEDVERWHVVNRRLAAALGAFCTVVFLGTLMLIRSVGGAQETQWLDPSRGPIIQQLFTSWPKAVITFLLCFGLTSLFAWGVLQYEKQLLLAVLSVPTGLVCLVTTLFTLPWLLSGSAMIGIEEDGLVDRQLGLNRIPWTRIERMYLREVNGMAYLCLQVSDEDELLSRSSWFARFNARCNRLFGFPAISLCLFPLQATTAEVAAILSSHGFELE